MPRKPRLVLPDVPVHVTQRGVDRALTFIAAEDFAYYRGALAEFAKAMGCRVHAYVLMTNHVHLLVSPGEATGLALLMQALGCRYVRYFNRRYARTGTLWEGRFRSALVQSPAYFLACSQYIERNPVMAGLAATPEAYPWSSFRHNACADVEVDSFLVAHSEYEQLGPTAAARRAAYHALFLTPFGDEAVARVRAELPGRPPANVSHRHVVASSPRWATVRHAAAAAGGWPTGA